MNSDDVLTTVLTNGKKMGRWEKIKALGIFLIGVSAVVTSITMLFLARIDADQGHKNRILIEENRRISLLLECRADKRDNLDRAIGRGLVAVANENPDALRMQAELIIAITEDLGECEL